MTPSAQKFSDIAPKLHSLFAVMLEHAQVEAQDKAQILALHTTPLHRLVRTLHRLLRVMITVEVYVHRADLKARMLADPAWRRRVIAQLGGLLGLQRWQDRIGRTPAALSPSRRTSKEGTQEQSVKKPRAEGDYPFRLPPIPRAAYARAERDIFAPTRDYNFKPLSALYDVPIIVTPCELRPKRRGHREPPNRFYPREPLVDIAWRDDPPETRPPRGTLYEK